MGRKKKLLEPDYKQDKIYLELTKKYFEMLKNENIGKTPKITKRLDELEGFIKTRKKILIEEFNR